MVSLMNQASLVVSCEHASAWIPHQLRGKLKIPEAVLESHRGYDIGAMLWAKIISGACKQSLLSGGCSRLIVDLNRSTNSRSLFSEYSQNLSDEMKKWVMVNYYHPYRESLRAVILKMNASKKRVVHLSVHSFTPVLNEKKRNCDFGVLYDPNRKWEKKIAEELFVLLKGLETGLRVRRNYPYKGVADGVTTAMRLEFSDQLYSGIELEINQDLVGRSDLAEKAASAIASRFCS